LEGEMNQLRRKLDDVKGKLEEALKEIKELKQEKAYWIESHKNHQKAIEALKEIALYEGDFYGDEMAQIAKEALKGLL
jgi:predicted nuclease with TOPRIM domain